MRPSSAVGLVMTLLFLCNWLFVGYPFPVRRSAADVAVRGNSGRTKRYSRFPQGETGGGIPLLLGTGVLGSLLLGLVARRRRTARELRADFPFFKHRREIYLDSAATAQKPGQVIAAISDHYARNSANVHRSGHSLGADATAAYEQSRKRIAEFFGVSDSNLVITRGATSAIHELARSLAPSLKPGDKIVVSEAAHSSNFLPWSELAKMTGAELVVIGAHAGESEIARELDSRVKIVAVPHLSHVFGSEFPLSRISTFLRVKCPEAVLIVDGSQAAGHLVPWIPEDVDAYVVSGHKMCGPTGVGATYMSNRLKTKIGNFSLGGGTVDWFDRDGRFAVSPFPYAFEAGTPPIAEAVGLGVAAEYLKERSEAVRAKEEDLRIALEKEVKTIPGVRLLEDKFPRVIPLVSLKFEDVSAADVAALISDKVCVRAGVHCAGPLHAAVGASDGSLRLSASFYNTEEEIKGAVRLIKKAVRDLQVRKGYSQ